MDNDSSYTVVMMVYRGNGNRRVVGSNVYYYNNKITIFEKYKRKIGLTRFLYVCQPYNNKTFINKAILVFI